MEQANSVKSKNSKKVELLSLLGNLEDKYNFCTKEKHVKFFPIIYDSLPSDWKWEDASSRNSLDIIKIMISFKNCPKDVITKILARKNIYRYELFDIFSNIYLDSHYLNQTIKNIVKKSIKKELTNDDISVLTSICSNPNLSDKDRLYLENMSINSKRFSYHHSFVLQCVKYSKRESWIRERFVDFNSSPRSFYAFIQNKICPDFILSFIALKEIGKENLVEIAKHQNVSLNTLEVLKLKSPSLERLIDSKIAQIIDDDSI